MTDIRPISRSAVEFVCLNMRAIDRAEVFGLRGYDLPEAVANETIFAAAWGRAGVAFHRGRPAAVVGVAPRWPGVWSAWAYGTEDFAKAALSVTRFALKDLKPFVLSRGGHRVEAASRIDHTEAHTWLRALGARDEGVLRGYGRDGADYVQFGWVREYDAPDARSPCSA